MAMSGLTTTLKKQDRPIRTLLWSHRSWEIQRLLLASEQAPDLQKENEESSDAYDILGEPANVIRKVIVDSNKNSLWYYPKLDACKDKLATILNQVILEVLPRTVTKHPPVNEILIKRLKCRREQELESLKALQTPPGGLHTDAFCGGLSIHAGYCLLIFTVDWNFPCQRVTKRAWFCFPTWKIPTYF